MLPSQLILIWQDSTGKKITNQLCSLYQIRIYCQLIANDNCVLCDSGMLFKKNWHFRKLLACTACTKKIYWLECSKIYGRYFFTTRQNMSLYPVDFPSNTYHLSKLFILQKFGHIYFQVSISITVFSASFSNSEIIIFLRLPESILNTFFILPSSPL